MKIQKIIEGIDDMKLSPQDKQVVKKVLDATGGDMVAATAVGQAKIAEKDKKPADPLTESEDTLDIPKDVCIERGYMIGRLPYTWITKDAIEILDYARVPVNYKQKLVDKGYAVLSFEDICDGVKERLEVSNDRYASDMAYSLKKYFEDHNVPVEESEPEEGSKAWREENGIKKSNPKSRAKKRFFDLDYESLEEDFDNFTDEDGVYEATEVVELDSDPENLNQQNTFDNLSSKQEICRDMSDSDEYVIDSAVDWINQCKTVDEDDIKDFVMNLCKTCDVDQFDCEPDFDRCSDFVVAIFLEGKDNA